jgi:hypothetical protein
MTVTPFLWLALIFGPNLTRKTIINSITAYRNQTKLKPIAIIKKNQSQSTGLQVNKTGKIIPTKTEITRVSLKNLYKSPPFLLILITS